MVKGNVVDLMRLNSNEVVDLLKKCIDIVGEMGGFDFDDFVSLDNDAYYNTTGFIKSKAFSYLLRYP